jgi:glycosyltransferase involved in cell wall biosynthesis
VRERLLAQAGLGAIGEDACLIAAGGAYAADRMSPPLLDAFARLPGHYALVFTSMGEGSARLAQLRARIGGAEWGRRVVALGELDFARLLECYAACDLGVLLYPNSGIGHYYQAPGRLTEYLRCGLAIVASNFPGFELLFCRHAIGATADPNDPASIAAALRSLGEMPAPERAARRARLVELALGELAYEAQAEAVIPQAVPGMAR